MNNKTYSLTLDKDEVRLVLESLLFSSSTDIMGSFDISFYKNAYELAKKIRFQHSDVLVENLEVFKPDNVDFEDDHVEEALQIFPEIRIEDINDL